MPITFIRHCGHCGFISPERNGCVLSHLPINPEEDFCSKFSPNPTCCSFCGNMFINSNSGIIVENYLVCGDCYNSLDTCRTCENSRTCEFETSSISIPKVVMKTQTFGNTRYQTQIKNPERIEKTCKKGCSCFDPQKGCLRETNFCKNYSLIKL